jgi:hypothetical protein
MPRRGLDPRRQARRPEEALLDRVRERLRVELVEFGPGQVGADERPEGRPARIDARVCPLELEPSSVDHIAGAAGADDLRALIGTATGVVRVRSLVAEHHGGTSGSVAQIRIGNQNAGAGRRSRNCKFNHGPLMALAVLREKIILEATESWN